MNGASSYLANVIVLRSSRVAVIALLVCIFHQHVTLTAGKVFERCELAQILRYGHGVDVNDVANWVCIAQHSSSLDSSAFRGNAKIGTHGIFQISDEYWCSPPGQGQACGISCDRLRDDDISDDFECVRKIHDEHQGLSGDGFNAWNAYQLYCKDNPYEYIEDCFGNEEREYIRSKSITTNYVQDVEEDSYDSYSKGKVYGRCELAKELFLKHKIPMEEIPTWVCIAQHESNYDTSAVGRLNTDGSADHGLFQISDLFWCSKKGGQRKACGVPCSKFLDSDITDDVKCVRQIHKEHTRISGDGFNAWTVYNAHCHGANDKYIRGCFDGLDVVESKPLQQYKAYVKPSQVISGKPHGKVYQPCELADDLRNKYHLPEDQIATWVCIAKHESGFNTSAIGYGDHGLFQISDIYWCSPPGKGWACGLSCADLEDSDISDDIECIRKIYDEHSHLSGDGFNAWTVYPKFCSNGRAEKYISHCPNYKASLRGAAAQSSYSSPISLNSIEEYRPKAKGKIYGRCELANELENKYHMPSEEIPTWVCIAQHESNFDTSAVGRLNADGSADHGLFQISDLFWCSNERDRDGYGKACGLPCSKFLDSDISDDIECVKQIHEEHTRISGNGFNAWTVYNAYCKDRVEQYTRGCTDGTASIDDFHPVQRRIEDSGYRPKNKPKGKVYEDCELARELRDKHRIPRDQIASWVCIAKKQSGLNTAASSADSHGMFFISDEFWCSPPGKGKACELHCSDLEDSDITDDVECVKKIYNEHQGISGNGFNAWRVYDQFCSNGRADSYINQCPGFESTSVNSIAYGLSANQYEFKERSFDVSKPVFNHAFNANPFLKFVSVPSNQLEVNQNPFFNQYQSVNLYQGNLGESFGASEDVPTVNHEYVANPFLNKIQTVAKSPTVQPVTTSTAAPIWKNPFLQIKTESSKSYNHAEPTVQPATVTTLAPIWKNPFLQIKTESSTAYNPFKAGSSALKTFFAQPSYSMSEEKAKSEIYKTMPTPPSPAFTVTPKANRLQPYHLNTIKTFETKAPFWLTTTTSRPTSQFIQNNLPFWQTTTTPKPTNRFQFFDSTKQRATTTLAPWRTTTTSKPTNRFHFSESTSLKSVAASPVWLTPTTQKPTSYFQVGQSTTKKPSSISALGAVPFWLTSTTLPPTTRRLQYIPPSSFNKTLTQLNTPFWQTTTTTKPTKFTFQPFNFINPTTTTTKSSTSSRIIPLVTPTIQTTQLRTTIKPTVAQHSGQYDHGRYNSGRYNSGKYDSPKNSPSSSKPTSKTTGFSFGKLITTTTKRPTSTTRTPLATTKSPWYSATSKTTKYDPFRQFPPTTLKPKSTTKSYIPLRSSTTRNSFQYTTPRTTARTTTTKPFRFSTIKPSLATTKLPTRGFSFQFTSPFKTVTSISSRQVSNSTNPRTTVIPTRTQFQKSTTSLQTIIPPQPTTTKGRTTPDSTSTSKSNIYDVYFKLYGVQPPSGTKTAP